MEEIGFYRQILDSMPGGLFVYHADGAEELIYANQAMVRIFGCESMEEFRELTGYSFRGIVHPDDIETVEESIWKQINGSSHALDYVEYRIIRKDGSVRWVEDYGHFAHTEQYGDVFYVFIEDVTERMTERMRQLEEMNRKLRTAYAKEAQYKNAILYESTAFFEANLTKNLVIAPVIQKVDGRQEDMFTVIGEKPVDKYSELVEYLHRRRHPSSQDNYATFFNADRLIRCYQKGELEQVYETWATDHTGRRRLYKYSFLLAQNEETQDVMGLCLLKDLTNLQEGKALLEIAFDRAKAGIVEKDNFLYNIARDVRKPVNTIIGYADKVKDVREDPGKLAEYLDKIQLYSVQMLNVVDGSMEYSQIESGTAPLSEKRGSIFGMLDELNAQFMHMADAKRQKFILDRSKVAHEYIVADFDRLKSLLYKLVDNAVKYTHEGGQVSLTVEEQQGIAEGYAKLRFIVEDNGVGMDAQMQEKIFEPFSRESELADSGIVGAGLGLSIVKGLVDMMEGNIQVESQPGKGSCFTVTLLFRLFEEDII